MSYLANKLKRWFVFLAILLVIDVAGAALWFQYLANKERGDFKHSTAQAVVILMGDFRPDHQALGPESLRRVNHALDLYRKGRVKNFLCVGGARPQRNAYGSAMMEKILIGAGVPLEHIFAEYKSNDSRSNWQEALSVIRAQQWRDIVVVSSPIHTHRVKRIAVNSSDHDHLNLYFSPYPYQSSRPTITFPEVLKRVHYEWVASLVYLVLPDSSYRGLVEWMRG